MRLYYKEVHALAFYGVPRTELGLPIVKPQVAEDKPSTRDKRRREADPHFVDVCDLTGADSEDNEGQSKDDAAVGKPLWTRVQRPRTVEDLADPLGSKAA